MKHIIYNRKNKQRGQVLLITAMLLATVISVVLAVTFRSTTDTQTTKLEEESQKALAAAEAGIEAAIRAKANISNIGSIVTGFTGNVSFQSASTGPVFVSPVIQKDEQYTLYLRSFDAVPTSPTYGTFSGSYVSGGLTFYFAEGSNCPTLEFTIIGADVISKREVVRSCDNTTISNTTASTQVNNNKQGYDFKYRATIAAGDISAADLIVVRFLSPTTLNSARFAVESSSNLPLQGSLITSQASSATGVTKIVQLFQSYPQIPSEFFVTSF